MNQSLGLKRTFSLGAVLEASTGMVLLIDPSFLSLLMLQAPLEGTGLAFGRIAGGALLSLGIACWYARATALTGAGLGVARAFFTYNLIASAVLLWAGPPLPGGLVALSAALFHGLLALALLRALFKLPKLNG